MAGDARGIPHRSAWALKCRDTDHAENSRGLFAKVDGRDAGDEAALQGFRSAAPGHDPVGRLGEQLRAHDERGPVPSRIQAAEYVGPGILATDGRAQSAAAIAEAADAPHRNVIRTGGRER